MFTFQVENPLIASMMNPPDQPEGAKGNILIVDDTPENLRLLSTMLSDRGYDVRSVINGTMALMGVQAEPPDLILLDIMMPQMNGYEVCEKLKENPQTCEIPVIFISALEDAFDKVKAFQAGGVDYITKPFQIEEVIARLENHLTLRRLQHQLQIQNARLQEEIIERQKAEEALQIYFHAVSHDLRNPVTGTLMVLQNWLRKSDSETVLSIPRTMIERLAEGCDRQLTLINSLLDARSAELAGIPVNCQPLNLQELIQPLVELWEPLLERNQATLQAVIPTDLPLVKADPNQLWRVLENLLANALKHNPPGLNLTLGATLEVNSLDTPKVRCYLADNGLGIASEQCQKLFDRYTRGSHSRHTIGLGLGLYLCREIIAAHGGEIGVESELGKGTKFWFTLLQA